MKRGKVLGPIVSTRRLWDAPNGALLEVELDKRDGGSHLIAFDVLGCGKEECVLVAQGSVAAAWFPGKAPPVDALIIASGEFAAPPARSATHKAKAGRGATLPGNPRGKRKV
jgi:ethanolamine utilization protein EutN